MKIITAVTAIVAILLSTASVRLSKDNGSNPILEDISHCANVSAETITEEITESEVTSIEETSDSTVYEIEVSASGSYKLSTELFHITVYVPSKKWGKLTKSGETAVHLKTCAVDPGVIPLGSTIVVNGLTLRANDTGSEIKGNDVDIFYDGTSEDAIKWISQFGDYHTVEVI